MSPRHAPLVIALALAAATLLPGCDRTGRMSEEEHIQRAKDYEDKGDLRASIVELKNAVQKNPNGAQARLLLAQIYIRAGLGPSAEKELRKAQQLGLHSETLKVPLGEALLLQQKFKETLEEIQIADTTSTANRARILSLRGEAMLGLGQPEEGCALHAQARATDARSTAAYRGLAQCALGRGNPAQATELLNTALKIDGKDARNWILLGDIEARRGQPSAAEKAYAQAMRVAPGNPTTHLAMAAFHVRQGKHQAANQLLDDIKTKFGADNLHWHSLKALSAFQQNRLEEADTHIGQILRMQPGHIPTLFLAGLTNYGLGRHEQAAGQLSKVLAVAPGLIPARMIQASIRLKQGQPKEASALLQPLDVEHATDPLLLSLAAQVAQAQGDGERAGRLMAAARRIDPQRAATATIDPASPDIHAAIGQLMAPAATPAQGAGNEALRILALIEKKEFDRALAAIAQMEKLQPKNPAIPNMRGVIALGRQDWRGARGHFQQALALDPDYFEAAANLAQLDLRDNNPKAAAQRMHALLERHPKHAHAMMVLADVAAAQGRENAYQDWLERARQAQPGFPDPALRLGQFHLAQGAPLKALDIARQLLETHPTHPGGLELLAQSQLATGDKGNALVSWSRLAQLVPRSAGAHYQVARLHLHRKDQRSARSALAKAIAIQPDYYDALHMLAILEIGAKKPDEAMKIARDAQTRAPQSAAGLILEGDVQMMQRKFAEAVASYEKALAVTDIGPLQIKLHQALRATGQVAVADTRLLRWLTAHPDDIGARYYLGEASMQAGNARQAIELFKAVVERAPRNALAMNNLAWLYDQEGNSLALPTAEKALALSPKSPVVQDTLGWILLRQGQTARSLELLRQAAASRDPSTQYHYAAALAQSGDKAGARTLLKQLLASKRSFPEAAEAEALLKRL